jgi:hypothetical protein
VIKFMLEDAGEPTTCFDCELGTRKIGGMKDCPVGSL